MSREVAAQVADALLGADYTMTLVAGSPPLRPPGRPARRVVTDEQEAIRRAYVALKARQERAYLAGLELECADCGMERPFVAPPCPHCDSGRPAGVGDWRDRL